MTHVHQHGGGNAAPAAKSTPAWRLLVTLAIAGAAAGWLVATVYGITLPAVQRHAAQQEAAAVREVLKAPARWDTLYLVNNALTKAAPPGVTSEWPRAYLGFDDAGTLLGAAVRAAEPGFQEELTLMVGFDPASGALTGFKILDQKETPGLGDKVESDKSFGAQFAGKIAPLIGVKGRPAAPPSTVQTITGATISSRAVIRIINDAVAKWQPLVQAYQKDEAK